MRDTSKRLLIGAIALLSLSTGCIGIQGNDALKYDAYPPPGLPNPSASVAVEVSVAVSGVAATNRIRVGTDRSVQRRILRALDQTENLTTLNDARLADYQLIIRITDKGGPGEVLLAAFLSGLTLTVLPAWVTHHYTVNADLIDASSGAVVSKVLTGKLTWATHFSLVLGMPFARFESVSAKMWNDITFDIAVWTVDQIGDRAIVPLAIDPL